MINDYFNRSIKNYTLLFFVSTNKVFDNDKFAQF